MKRILLPLAFLLVFSHFACQAGENEKPIAKILFGSCLDAGRPHPILGTAAGIEHDLFIFLGDNIYADTTNAQVMKAKYRTLARSPFFQGLLESSPVLAVWDDHDYGRNDAGGDFPMKEESQRLFLDFWKVPPDAPRRRHDGIYDSAVFGPAQKSIQVILLDTRFFRTPLKRGRAPTVAYGPYLQLWDVQATILGESQWEWLAGEPRRPARVRIIASSIQVLSPYQGWEAWANFPLEQQRLLDLLEETEAKGVVFFSGDRHFAEITALRRSGYPPLYDVTSSGLNVTFPGKAPNENALRECPAYLEQNFGMFAVEWTERDPLITFRIYDARGGVRIERSVKLSALSLE